MSAPKVIFHKLTKAQAERRRKLWERRWKPSWVVWMDWNGDKWEQLPFLEYLLGKRTDGSGTFMDGSGIVDCDWGFKTLKEARRAFEKLKDIAKTVRFAHYIQIRLMHDWKCGETWNRLDVYTRGRKSRGKCVPRRAS